MIHYTTIEQSKKLVNLGLNPESADMLWEQHDFESPYVTVKPYTTKGKSIGAHILPCWSLGALIDLIPHEEWHDMLNTAKKENLIDDIFDVICWCLVNKYIVSI